jgi:DNA-binding transcriptional LysR family regulator
MNWLKSLEWVTRLGRNEQSRLLEAWQQYLAMKTEREAKGGPEAGEMLLTRQFARELLMLTEPQVEQLLEEGRLECRWVEGHKEIPAESLERLVGRPDELRRLQLGWKPWTAAEDKLLGKRPDRVIAEKLGRPYYSVRDRRRFLGIKPMGSRVRHGLARAWTPAEDALLGTGSDEEIGQRIGRTESAVKMRRWLMRGGVPGFGKMRPWTPEDEALLGTAPDPEVAWKLGRRTGAVGSRRKLLGIPGFVGPGPGKRPRDFERLWRQAIVIGTTEHLAMHELADRLKGFRDANPLVYVRVELQRPKVVYRAVLQDRVDLGFLMDPWHSPDWQVIPVAKERMVLICAPSHPLAGRKRIVAQELAGQKYIRFNAEDRAVGLPERVLAEERVIVDRAGSFDSIETVKQAVKMGAGVSIVPEDTVRQEVAARVLAQVALEPFEREGLMRVLAVVRRKTKVLSPEMEQFIAALKEPL